MLVIPSLFLQTKYQPTNAINNIQLMTSIKILQSQNLYSFVLEDSLRMASCAETCNSLMLVMNCILLNALEAGTGLSRPSCDESCCR